MNFAEFLLSNAIKYSMMKNCFANIVFAGPIYSGKKNIAQIVADFLDVTNFEKSVTIFSELDYLKPYNKNVLNEYGTISVDSKSAYDVKRYLEDVKKFFETGYVCSGVYLPKAFEKSMQDDLKKKSPAILTVRQKRKVNIFTGPHVIDLLKEENVEIPEAIYIFLNANIEECIKKRIKAKVMLPKLPLGSSKWKEYNEFIIKQNEEEVLPQKERAQIVINLN